MTKDSAQAMAQSNEALMRWQPLFEAELAQVDALMLKLTAREETPVIAQIVQHIVHSGGKRIRPILTLLSAKLCGYKGEDHIRLAACIELLHTATLLHDDVVDMSELRRGQPTANMEWGNALSVLVGDFLLSRAFQLMAQVGSLPILSLLADSSAVITEGEVKQLMAMNDITTDEEIYIDIIVSKTSQLFAAACEVGAILAGVGPEKQQALGQFGQQLGVAFQIADDALDYSARQQDLGKTIGDDFREGKITLPVILAYQAGDAKERSFWEQEMSEGGREENLQKALSLLQKHQSLDHTMQRAQIHVEKAAKVMESFPESDAKQALLDILRFAVSRPY